jgi:hypothetical protein
MRRTSVRTLGILIVASLAYPASAHANIWDIIWKMSGPQMMGFPLHCEWALGDKDTVPNPPIAIDRVTPGPPYTRFECRELDFRFYGKVKPRYSRRVWLSIDGGPYFSTGKDPHGGIDPDFEKFSVWMVAVEPLLEVRSGTRWGIMFNHGVGATYDVLFGDGFATFDKAGIKFKPITATIARRINASFTLRWYPTGTTLDEFGRTSSRPDDFQHKNEVSPGFSVGVLW